jgi:hypothetical protein
MSELVKNLTGAIVRICPLPPNMYLRDNKEVQHPSRPQVTASVVHNFLHLKVLKSMNPKDQEIKATLKWNTVQLFTVLDTSFVVYKYLGKSNPSEA